MLDLAFGGGGNQVFVFNNTLVLHGVLIGLLILLFTLAVVFIAYRYARYVTSKQVKIGIYLFLFSCIAPQLTHAYAAAANVSIGLFTAILSFDSQSFDVKVGCGQKGGLICE